RFATVGSDTAGGQHARGTCSGPYGFGHQFVAQMGRTLGQRLHQPRLIRLLVSFLALPHVLLAELHHAVDSLGDLTGGGDDRLGAASAALDKAIEGAEGVLGAMTPLRPHPQGAGHAVSTPPGATLEDLAAAAAMLRTQAQPAHEILLVRKGTQV